MKAFWRISLSFLMCTCTGIATAAIATPYTFNESSNANSASNRAPVYPMYTDSSNSGLPDALTGNEGPIEFKKSRNTEVEWTASNQPFMKEVGSGGREFSPNGGSIKSTPAYGFSEASQLIPVEEWYGGHIRGQGPGQGQWQGQGRRHRNRNRNFQGGGFQSARELNNNFDFINNANPNLNNNNNNSSIGASSFGTNRLNNAGFGNNNFSSNNNNNNNTNFSSNSLNNNNFNNFGNNNPNRNNKRNRNRKNPDPTVDVKQPDRVADNPQVDGDGVRHFSNGKHLDLSKMSLDQAIGATNASGDDPFPGNRNSRNNYNAGNEVNNANAISNAPPLTIDNSYVSSSATRRHLPYQAK